MARGDCKASSAPGSPEFLLLGNWKRFPLEKKHHAVIYKQINISCQEPLSSLILAARCPAPTHPATADE